MLGLTLSLFCPKKPPLVPTPGLVLQGAVTTKSQVMFCAPAFLKAWSSNKANLKLLRMFQSIVSYTSPIGHNATYPDIIEKLYGGSPMWEDISNFLVQQGIKMLPILGLSETGCITIMIPSELYFFAYS
jgi:hypothetical protein